MATLTTLATIEGDKSSTYAALVGGVDLIVAIARLLLAPGKTLKGDKVSHTRDYLLPKLGSKTVEG